ncbi:unnamed protein product [Rotaria socialis]
MRRRWLSRTADTYNSDRGQTVNIPNTIYVSIKPTKSYGILGHGPTFGSLTVLRSIKNNRNLKLLMFWPLIKNNYSRVAIKCVRVSMKKNRSEMIERVRFDLQQSI